MIGKFPIIGSRFVSFYGLATVLDPVLILLVDVAAKQYSCEEQSTGCAQDLGRLIGGVFVYVWGE